MAVFGASAGGLDPLIEIVSAIPGEANLSVFVVLHVAPSAPSALPGIIARHADFAVVVPVDGMEFLPRHIYVAPPGRHLVLQGNTVHLSYGPKEHGFRPSIDVLFRSAARAVGPRVVGVVLSGGLSDGVTGASAIRSAGGVVLVQDPEEALHPQLPSNAIAAGVASEVLPASGIGPRIAALALEVVADWPEVPLEPAGSVLTEIRHPGNALLSFAADVREIQHDIEAQEQGRRIGDSSMFVCPDCGGVLWEQPVGDVVGYRCHVGHTYSLNELIDKRADEIEHALWTAIRALEEHASLNRRMAARMVDGNGARSNLRERFERRAQDAEEKANHLRGIVPPDPGLDVGSEHR